MDGSEDGGGGGGEIYEKILPVHGDEYSHNLISTIQRNPGQVFCCKVLLDENLFGLLLKRIFMVAEC